MCIYIYIYTYIHTYIHTYIYTCIPRHGLPTSPVPMRVLRSGSPYESDDM